MGEGEIAAFRQQNPDAGIKEVSGSSGATGSEVLFFRQNPGQYDFSLEDQSGLGQLVAGDILEEVDWMPVPNITNVDKSFRDAYSHAVPPDYGRVGIGQRTDLAPEGSPRGTDVWTVA